MVRLLLAWMLIFCTGTALAETRDVNAYFFDQKFGDFRAELGTAKKDGKKGILIMYELEDCPFCHRMKQTILNQSEIQDYYRSQFLIFAVDANGAAPMTDFKGGETTEKTFAAQNRVRATPVFVFYDLAGNEMKRFTGAARDAAEFLQFGHYVAEGAYQSMPFAKYRQQGGK